MAQKKLEPHADLIEERYYKKLESFKAISEALRELGCDVTPQGVSAYLRRRERKRAERLQRLAGSAGEQGGQAQKTQSRPAQMHGPRAQSSPAERSGANAERHDWQTNFSERINRPAFDLLGGGNKKAPVG